MPPTLPPTTPTTTTEAPTTLTASCLCVFDVDRTLTTKQGQSQKCPGSRGQHGIYDTAYSGGELVMSALGAAGVAGTFCEQCHMAIVTHGDCSGRNSKERTFLLNNFLRSSSRFTELCQGMGIQVAQMPWSGPGTGVNSPLVFSAPDRHKQDSVTRIIEWQKKHGVGIQPSDVYFFDDRADNVAAFHGTGYNARQVSCKSRDGTYGGVTGFCGATVQEIRKEAGVKTCADMGLQTHEHWMSAEPDVAVGEDTAQGGSADQQPMQADASMGDVPADAQAAKTAHYTRASADEAAR